MLKFLPRIGKHNYRTCCRQSSINSPSLTKTSSFASDSGCKQYKSFDELITQRRNEAGRSIVVQVPSERACKALIAYCTSFGTVSNCFFYQNRLQANYFLLEFKTSFSAASVLQAVARSQRNEIALKALNHFLVFSPNAKCRNDSVDVKNKVKVQRAATELQNLSAIIRRQDTIEGQVLQLYERTRLNELATRLRFLAAQQIEAIVTSVLPTAKVLPFGSSVNGFGRMGSDLDVVLSFDHTQVEDDPPLKFNSKEQPGSERSYHLVMLQTAAMLMGNWTPGVAKLQPILHAKVPIVKYQQSFLDLDVDLSAHNLSGFYMSELLYLFGEIDARVRPLNFFMRRWAEEWKVTRVIRPGPWISNFTLSCIVLFFLQQLKQPILPTIDELKRQARDRDKRPMTDNSDCIFLRDINQLRFQTANTDSLEQLIGQFFDFCASTDFATNIISLNTGQMLPNSVSKPMHIVNPLEPEHNVSANVSHQEIVDFTMKAKQAGKLFYELQQDFSQPTSKKFLQFFEHAQGNDMHMKIISKIKSDIQRTLQRTHSKKKNSITVRSLTKLT